MSYLIKQVIEMNDTSRVANMRRMGAQRNADHKRIPLANSFKHNQLQTIHVDNTSLKQTIASLASEGNEENAESRPVSVSVASGVANAIRSKIPIDMKKAVKPKASLRSKPTQESEPTQELAFSSNLLPNYVENIDINDTNNVFLTPDYVNEIYCYLRYLEGTQNIKSNFLSIQPEMTPRMRSVLVDWLINVHNQFQLLPETLFLGISIMDRFFQKEIVSKDKIQLVGVTAFFIASKFEEIYPPDIKDFVLICDQLYHTKDIIKMEMTVLRALKFELGRPLPLHFLRRNSKAAHADSKIHALAKYLMELTLVEYECSHWDPSLLAATSLYVSLKILGDSSKWTPTLEFYSNYTEKQLLPNASLLCKIIKKSEKSKFQNCRRKYASNKFLEVSKHSQLKSPIIDKIAALQP